MTNSHGDYVTSFEECSDDIIRLVDQFGKERTIQKLYGALDAIVIALNRLNGPVRPYVVSRKETAA